VDEKYHEEGEEKRRREEEERGRRISNEEVLFVLRNNSVKCAGRHTCVPLAVHILPCLSVCLRSCFRVYLNLLAIEV